MYIKKLKISNFKSIYDELELDFNNIKGLWKISGPVGVGKTSIGEAIIFGLFGTVGGKNNADLISWGEKHSVVEIWLESKGKQVYIKRENNAYGQSPVYVEVDNENMVYTNKRDAQAQLENEIYDTSRTSIELLCIISFNNFKSLATLNTADTKRFLDQVLDFYTLSNYSDICKELKLDIVNKLDKEKNKLSNIEYRKTKLEQLQNKILIEGNIEDVKKDINAETEKIKVLYNNYMQKRNELEPQIKSLETQITEITVTGKTLAKNIKFMEQGICPTCGAPIDQTKLPEEIVKRGALAGAYKLKTQELNELKNKLNNIINEYTKEKNKCDENVSKLSKLRIQLESQSKTSDINENELIEIQDEIETCNANIDKYNIEVSEWSQLYNILSNDVRSKILGSFIPSLNNNIMKYATQLQQPYIIQFDSQFKCNIKLVGFNQQIPITSLSTGQLKTVDMIIILGVLGTIIGSNGINILFLDELFSNMDQVLLNDMCSVLKNSIDKENNTMFIISHNDIDSSHFDGDISMKLENVSEWQKKSRIRIKKSDFH